MLAPFTSVAEVSRTHRFIAYMAQSNLVILALMAVFGPAYRHGDLLRQSDFLDGRDMQIMQSVAVIGAVALLPLMQFKSALLQYLLCTIYVATSVLLLAGSVYLSKETPMTN